MREGRTRPGWDRYFMKMAELVSTRATCPRASVGVVVVRENRVLLTGYNGAPPGQDQCDEHGCDLYSYAPGALSPVTVMRQASNLTNRCQRAVHAEQNVIAFAAREGINIRHATWYLYPFGPCRQCQNLMVVTEPEEIVYPISTYNQGLYQSADVLLAAGAMINLYEPVED